MPHIIAHFPQPKPDIGSLELTEQYIRTRAYQFYERRGRQDGFDLEDWLRAESEIFGRKPSPIIRQVIEIVTAAAA